ncbi:MAG: Hsp20/alpha crystallin family protein [SAR324 cluster bacterium]|nr:Hsp20/alpha crystallin family protein [SAR324 cluster bacterium]MCZ6730197.1 Hsp20/alpha crystallin family protein [SAR324 cluster bacterium]MCZ6842732.1 Hsp20/alpha crystallin family protein [SAR324 cluster bacterium]
MNLVHYTPNRWFDTAFDRLFTDFWPTVAAYPEARAGNVISPRVEIHNGENEIVLTAEIPGLGKSDLQIEVNGRVLTLSGEKKEEHEAKENGYYRSERVYGSFKRSFTLPDGVDAEKISASVENGVLHLSLPKKPEAKPKRIEIEDATGEAKKIEVS